jgi:hypothetical protein
MTIRILLNDNASTTIMISVLFICGMWAIISIIKCLLK